ncbi:glycoside hydrolase family 3 protein [Rhodanobacter sp. 115]|uniref:glycoside hydrolase family 3 protein n=1 Tax=Rhodanobacter sp. FW021-MT20 TaxID=1162282 RepID=UPI000260DB5D|nr:glycoside hydrolase family 3 protein [Rhodanobacter sp. 115]EIL91245.1 beta-glucosidase [Rhodanobacter sp. 115]
MQSMNTWGRSFALYGIAVATLLFAAAPAAWAKTIAAKQTQPLYLDTAHSFQERAADLVSRMTLAEKVAQMQNSAPAIPRLGVPAYDWWNEALHGVARAGEATVFPQAIGLAATFDPALLHHEATAISDEARAKYNDFQRRGMRGRYEGLTFWSPNTNIFRDPRWGRGQETYGEDPYLTSRMGVAFVRGLEGDDPTYQKLDATAKHFAVHSGPESERHRFDVHPSERDLHETYLPAFQALVQQGGVDAVMGAYNRVDGVPATASHRLLQDILRRDWGFKGYVVSDCDAVADIYQFHKVVPTAEQAAALAVNNGDDLNCGTTYATLVKAVHDGLVNEHTIDTAVTRLMLARFRLGMFDPPGRVPWSTLPMSVVQSPQHDALALRTAQESMVLLKNDGLLPLSHNVRRIAVIGPTADNVTALLGNYHGTPKAPVTILQGIREAVPNAQVTYVQGTELVQGFDGPDVGSVIGAAYLRPAPGSGAHGLKGEYFRGADFTAPPVMTRIDPQIGFHWIHDNPTDALVARGALPAAQSLEGAFVVRWSGELVPPVSGRYELGAAASSGFRLYLDGHLLLDRWSAASKLRGQGAFVDLKAGKAYAIRLDYLRATHDAGVRLAWRMPGAKSPFEAALDAARHADVVIFAGGLSSDLEGEEMPVDYPGFAGGDRTTLALPATQRKLLQALQVTGKPVVLVLTTGSALAIDWAKQHLPAILLAWYPGQDGGHAVADALFGNVDPAGRLPVTFYKSARQLPPFDDYAMKGRTYRYFTGQPLFPFGFGLSYTRFAYSDLQLDRDTLGPSDRMRISLRVKNTGQRAGDEVVQLYLRPLRAPHARAIKSLRGFQRISLKPGEERSVSFDISPQTDLKYYDVAHHAYAVAPGRYQVQVGASSADIRLTRDFTVQP